MGVRKGHIGFHTFLDTQISHSLATPLCDVVSHNRPLWSWLCILASLRWPPNLPMCASLKRVYLSATGVTMHSVLSDS